MNIRRSLDHAPVMPLPDIVDQWQPSFQVTGLIITQQRLAVPCDDLEKIGTPVRNSPIIYGKYARQLELGMMNNDAKAPISSDKAYFETRAPARELLSTSDQLFKSTQPIKAPAESRRSQQYEVELEQPASTKNDLWHLKGEYKSDKLVILIALLSRVRYDCRYQAQGSHIPKGPA